MNYVPVRKKEARSGVMALAGKSLLAFVGRPGGGKVVLDLDQSLQLRIADFKSDPEKMRQVNEFLNELFEAAKTEVQSKQGKHKSHFDAFGLQNGTRRIGAWSSRARTSARTFANRLFTAICNCTNTVKSAVVNRN
ncbi:hypothetical protein Trydic_g6090 [Trypoxylus dichotomus]